VIYSLNIIPAENFLIASDQPQVLDDENWKKPSWRLWNLRESKFTPLISLSSYWIPIRKIGNRIFLKNEFNSIFYKYDREIDKEPTQMQSSTKIVNCFLLADGSMIYTIEDSECENFKGRKNSSFWSVFFIVLIIKL